MKKISIIIVTYNSSLFIEKCINRLYSSIGVNIDQCIVIDNGSHDDTIKKIKKNDNILLIKGENIGFARGVNKGMRYVKNEFVCVVNPDLYVKRDTISEMLNVYKVKNNVGIVGSQQVFQNGSWQRSYGIEPGILSSLFDIFFITFLINRFNRIRFNLISKIKQIKQVRYVDGAIFIVETKLFRDMGMFDEDYFFYSEEADLCYRLIQNNRSNFINTAAISEHYRGGSSTIDEDKLGRFSELNATSNILFLEKNKPNALKYVKKLKVLYFFEMWLIYTILGFFAKKNFLKNKQNYINKQIQVWKRYSTK